MTRSFTKNYKTMRVITYPAGRRTRRHNMHNLMNTFFNAANKPLSGANAPVNVAENEDAFRVELAAPGWKKADFNIELDQDVLTLSATHATEENKENEVTFLRREFGAKDFKRTFNLPETVDTQAISATYEAGILTLTLPKKEEAKPQAPRKVEIA